MNLKTIAKPPQVLPAHGVLHIVSGQQGQYSDQSVWTVAAYLTRSAAEEHLRLIKEEVRARGDKLAAIEDMYGDEWCAVRDLPFTYDPSPQGFIDVFNVEYSLSVLYLTESPDTFPAEMQVLTDLAKTKGWIP